MKKRAKKLLLSISVGCATIGWVVPISINHHSRGNQNDDFMIEKMIGESVALIHKNQKYDGILLKVDENNIYIDLGSLWEPIIAFPLTFNAIIVNADEYCSPSYIVNNYLSKFKTTLNQNIDYQLIQQKLENFVEKITDQQAKKLGQEMLYIFNNNMTYWTSEKIDEAIQEVLTTNKLNKWQQLVDYYVNKFAWSRQDIFQKIYDLQNDYNVSMVSADVEMIEKLCDVLFEMAFTNFIKLQF